MFIKREENWGAVAGCWNALVLMVLALLLALVAINVFRWALKPAPEPEAEECLVLMDGPVGSEPDYRLGRAEECRADD